MRRLVWFSCGAASAVAAKVAVDKYGESVRVIYCDTMSTEHEDNARFLVDVEKWIGRKIEFIKSTKYADVNEVFEKRRYMAGKDGAPCTTEMKKVPRVDFQQVGDIHILGYTAEPKERIRAENFEEQNKSLQVEWILIDEGIDKDECKRRLTAAGIPLPAMYALGFEHNNCKGCVKSQSAGYWNRTRRFFPEVFQRRAELSRRLGVRLVKLGHPDEPGGKRRRLFLDELPPDADAPDDEIDCGPACQTPLDLSDLLGPE